MRRLKWIIAAALSALAVTAIARPAMFYEAPPKRYQGPFTVNFIALSSVEAVSAACKANGSVPVPGRYYVGCYVSRTNTIIGPPPCGKAWGLYGELMCHEGGHSQGWSGEHEK
jgi:hypothetical protein